MSQPLDRLVADNLDIWTSATERKGGAGRGGGKRVSLYGIERLRALILDLAVRGKLVPQGAGMELAAKKGMLGDQPSLSFEVPASWCWVTIKAVADCRLGKMLDARKNTGELKPYLRNANVRWFDFDLSDLLQMRFEPAELLEFSLQKGDVLICEGGEPGRTAVWDGRATDIYFQKAIHRVRLNGSVSPDFFALCIKRSTETGELRSYFTGSGIQHFTGRSLDRYAFPLPPLAEQRRIVAKVDEVMALCDALERESAGEMAAHAQLVAELLGTLVNSADSAALSASWARLERHFDTLFTTDASIDALKQTILDLAVRGKLVEQDAGEEAKQALKTIAAERAEMAAAGVIRARSQSGRSTTVALPFTLPQSWTWCRLSELGGLENGDRGREYPNKSALKPSGVPFVNTGHLQNGLVDQDQMTFISEDHYHRLGGGKFREGDILYCLRGSLGKAAVVAGIERGAIASSLVIIRLAPSFLREFMMIYLGSHLAGQMVRCYDNGTAQPNLSSANLERFLVPLPPLAEQHRIVAKVNELMALCDALKARIADAATTQKHLADAIVKLAAA